jgi:hypothetical protein
MGSPNWTKAVNTSAASEQAEHNQDALSYARSIMTEEQFAVLKKAYRQLQWFQIAPFVLCIIVLAALSVIYPDKLDIIWIFGACIAIVFYILALIISQFCVGRPWHQYIKLIRKGESKDSILLHLFDMSDEKFDKFIYPYNMQYSELAGEIPNWRDYECSHAQYYDAIQKALKRERPLSSFIKKKSTQ